MRTGNRVETKTGKPLFLKDKSNRPSLVVVTERLKTVTTQNAAESNDRQRAQETRAAAIDALHPLFKQARTFLKGVIDCVPGTKALPAFVAATADPQKYLRAAKDVQEIWQTLDVLNPASHPELGLPFTIPVLVGEDTVQVTLAEYAASVDAFENAVMALETAKAAEPGPQDPRRRPETRESEAHRLPHRRKSAPRRRRPAPLRHPHPHRRVTLTPCSGCPLAPRFGGIRPRNR